jgi:mRNA interferase RelE/StbE
MRYSILIEEKAQNFIKKLNKNAWMRVRDKIRNLAENPRLGKPLTAGLTGFWSLRIGDYRAIYQIKDFEIIVFVVKVGHRKNVY